MSVVGKVEGGGQEQEGNSLHQRKSKAGDKSSQEERSSSNPFCSVIRVSTFKL